MDFHFSGILPMSLRDMGAPVMRRMERSVFHSAPEMRKAQRGAVPFLYSLRIAGSEKFKYISAELYSV